ncbi:hypothetical protein [Actinophytocola glycyrrhizae]|uniref:Uncharacterized protein n=1 Tax=Actinophytocola glycyrrhizae TaxID=2044873 RepID=A0ABV9SHB4_9PSEU
MTAEPGSSTTPFGTMCAMHACPRLGGPQAPEIAGHASSIDRSPTMIDRTQWSRLGNMRGIPSTSYPESARSVAQLVQISVPFASTETITIAMLP